MATYLKGCEEFRKYRSALGDFISIWSCFIVRIKFQIVLSLSGPNSCTSSQSSLNCITAAQNALARSINKAHTLSYSM